MPQLQSHRHLILLPILILRRPLRGSANPESEPDANYPANTDSEARLVERYLGQRGVGIRGLGH